MSGSIDATRAGGDINNFPFLKYLLTFLSTPPSRVATQCRGWFWRIFSVSIHATLAGGDFLNAALSNSAICFYPRHPRGWRQNGMSFCLKTKMFLSTPPSRVATVGVPYPAAYFFCFYPRHPRGWRLDFIGNIWRKQSFYPRHPRGWRPPPFLAGDALQSLFLSTPPSRVATQAPGCHVCIVFVFLSTPPSRVATSILFNLYRIFLFLSTPPSRVAT